MIGRVLGEVPDFYIVAMNNNRSVRQIPPEYYSIIKIIMRNTKPLPGTFLEGVGVASGIRYIL
jgi:hypothetical protein